MFLLVIDPDDAWLFDQSGYDACNKDDQEGRSRSREDEAHHVPFVNIDFPTRIMIARAMLPDIQNAGSIPRYARLSRPVLCNRSMNK
jgi:hypothetical protein